MRLSSTFSTPKIVSTFVPICALGKLPSSYPLALSPGAPPPSGPHSSRTWLHQLEGLLPMADLSYNQFAIHRKFSLSLYCSCNLELPHCLCTFLHNQADTTVDSGFLLHSSPLQCASCLCPSDTAFSKVTNNHSFAKLNRGFEVLILHDLFVALKIGDSGVSFLGFCAAS